MATTSLRERMLMALRIRNMSRQTERIYIDLVARFALHFHRSPDRLRRSSLRASQAPPRMPGMNRLSGSAMRGGF